MSNVEFKKILAKDMSISWGNCGLLNFNDEYVLVGSGILIDKSGKLIWSSKLEHYFSKAVYIKEKEIIITDRTICFGMGGDFHLGIACIDMKTGKYKWKHFYDEGRSRFKLRNREPDINMVKNIGDVDIIKGCIYCDGFEIDLENGSYKYTGEKKRRKAKDDNVIYSKTVESLQARFNGWSENTENIKVNIDVIYIDGQEFSKEGYFFNKCDFYISSNDSIYFWGIPAKRNPENAILFRYSKIEKSITEEIELPIRKAPFEVYDFFGKGVLFIFNDSIWLFKGLLSEGNMDANQHISEKRNSFEDSIMGIVDSKDMEKLIMKVGYINMAYALKPSSSKVYSHVENLCSKHINEEIEYTMKIIGPCRLQDAIEAQNFILGSLWWLEI